MNRRQFLATSALALGTIARPRMLPAQPAYSSASLRDRIHGLMVGSMIGDALGGPIEFQPAERIAALVNPPRRWQFGDVMDEAARKETGQRLELRAYTDLRPEPQPYAHWIPNAPAGTITDDSRHKLILLEAFKRAEETGRWPLTVNHYAQAHLDWPKRPAIQGRPSYAALCTDWLREWEQGARWVLGERDPATALPPERMWGGLPTCSGQMALLPLAALFPGRPEQAYRATYQLGFFDNGFGKDLNAALVAGLAAALVQPATTPAEISEAWTAIETAMRQTDPYAYAKVPWVTRPVDRWLGLARKLAREADRQPARLFAALEAEFQQTIKWEAQVPFVVAFACLKLCDHDPLAALQLSVEWGHDTDSYAQVVGAFIGAVHGAGVFPETMRNAVEARLSADFGVDLADHTQMLVRLAGSGRRLIAPE
ncbi:MAG TPA: hypothetical protein DCY13_09460 [Verrucomicrobiales bacterium]|nr:hypothetical protein [Verrucomicrobiales bacterium]